MRQDDDRRGGHVDAALNLQLVLVTNDRRGVLTGEHLLVAYPPHVPVARLVNSLKGVSARRLRQPYRVRTHREHL
jgi:REP-associated tyrosine transposase